MAEVVDELNAARRAQELPVFSVGENDPIVFGAIDEKNPRGPSGEPLKNRLPNQEIFFATFAALPTGKRAIVFITDPLRSNAELTSQGVPGRAAVFTVDMKLERKGSDEAVVTNWSAQNEVGDRVHFSAKYTSADIVTRGRVPDAAQYLACSMGDSFPVVFRSLPLQAFSFFDQFQASLIRDLTRSSVVVDLKVDLVDPIVNAIFNDPTNRYLQLIEVDRVVRLQRLP